MNTSVTELEPDENQVLSLLSDELQHGRAINDAVRAALIGYPQHASAIASYAVQAAALGPRESESPTQPKAQDNHVMVLIEKSIAMKRQERRSREITSLLQSATRHFGTSLKLAEALSVGHSVLIKLDRRLIEFKTIPANFLNALADHLKISRNALDNYLGQSPRLAPAAEYKSRRRPSAGARQSFAQAVAASIAIGEAAPEQSNTWSAPTE